MKLLKMYDIKLILIIVNLPQGAPAPNDYSVGAPAPNDYSVGAPAPNDYSVGAPAPNDYSVGAPASNDYSVGLPATNDYSVGVQAVNGYSIGSNGQRKRQGKSPFIYQNELVRKIITYFCSSKLTYIDHS